MTQEQLNSVIPGEPKAREGDRVQDEAPSSLPLVGRARVGVWRHTFIGYRSHPHLHLLPTRGGEQGALHW
jgi:hypothetical protein